MSTPTGDVPRPTEIITYGRAEPACVFCSKATRLKLVNIGQDRAVWMCHRHAKHGPSA